MLSDIEKCVWLCMLVVAVVMIYYSYYLVIAVMLAAAKMGGNLVQTVQRTSRFETCGLFLTTGVVVVVIYCLYFLVIAVVVAVVSSLEALTTGVSAVTASLYSSTIAVVVAMTASLYSSAIAVVEAVAASLGAVTTGVSAVSMKAPATLEAVVIAAFSVLKLSMVATFDSLAVVATWMSSRHFVAAGLIASFASFMFSSRAGRGLNITVEMNTLISSFILLSFFSFFGRDILQGTIYRPYTQVLIDFRAVYYPYAQLSEGAIFSIFLSFAMYRIIDRFSQRILTNHATIDSLERILGPVLFKVANDYRLKNQFKATTVGSNGRSYRKYSGADLGNTTKFILHEVRLTYSQNQGDYEKLKNAAKILRDVRNKGSHGHTAGTFITDNEVRNAFTEALVFVDMIAHRRMIVDPNSNFFKIYVYDYILRRLGLRSGGVYNRATNNIKTLEKQWTKERH